uniref:Uncharacterized protein n=1 Tax=Magallana gigas TaxID=29159 RepID=K1P6G5_MAGGI
MDGGPHNKSSGLLVNLMRLQDEKGWVDTELFMRQVADLQVLKNCDRVKRICALK